MEETTQIAPISDVAVKPQFLKVLCILSYIGSGIWALLSLIGIFASSWIMSLFMSGAMSKVDTSSMTPEQVQAMEAMSSGSGLIGVLSSYIVVIFIISLILSGISIFGVMKMSKLQKSGFWIYASVNGLLAILGLIGGGVFGSIIGIGFIVMYGLNLKHMK